MLIRYRLKERDVGDENGWMLAALLLDVVETRDRQRDWIGEDVLIVDNTAVASSITSIKPEK